MNKRANIFDDADELDVGAFKPETAPAPEPDREKLKAISDASNFPSRQAKPLQAPAPTRREPRRHRTEATPQLNVKTRPRRWTSFIVLQIRRAGLSGKPLNTLLRR